MKQKIYYQCPKCTYCVSERDFFSWKVNKKCPHCKKARSSAFVSKRINLNGQTIGACPNGKE